MRCLYKVDNSPLPAACAICRVNSEHTLPEHCRFQDIFSSRHGCVAQQPLERVYLAACELDTCFHWTSENIFLSCKPIGLTLRKGYWLSANPFCNAHHTLLLHSRETNRTVQIFISSLDRELNLSPCLMALWNLNRRELHSRTRLEASWFCSLLQNGILASSCLSLRPREKLVLI